MNQLKKVFLGFIPPTQCEWHLARKFDEHPEFEPCTFLLLITKHFSTGVDKSDSEEGVIFNQVSASLNCWCEYLMIDDVYVSVSQTSCHSSCTPCVQRPIKVYDTWERPMFCLCVILILLHSAQLTSCWKFEHHKRWFLNQAAISSLFWVDEHNFHFKSSKT